VSRVQVEEVGLIGQRLGLEPNRADVLPVSKVILVPFAPGRDVGGRPSRLICIGSCWFSMLGVAPPTDP
jgi:hypothetical protein